MSQAGYKCDCLQTMQDVMSGFTCHVLDKKAAKSQVIAVEDSDSEFLEPPSAKSPSPVLQKTPDAKDTVEELVSPEKVTNPRRRLSFSKIAQKVRDLQDMKKASQSGSDDEQQVGEGPRWPGWPQPLQIGGRYFCRAIRLDYPEDEPALEPRDYLLNGCMIALKRKRRLVMKMKTSLKVALQKLMRWRKDWTLSQLCLLKCLWRLGVAHHGFAGRGKTWKVSIIYCLWFCFGNVFRNLYTLVAGWNFAQQRSAKTTVGESGPGWKRHKGQGQQTQED